MVIQIYSNALSVAQLSINEETLYTNQQYKYKEDINEPCKNY